MPLDRWFRRLTALALTLTCGSVEASPPVPLALSPHELTHLEEGRPVVHQRLVEEGRRRYIGGVSYVLIHAPPEKVLSFLDNVDNYRHFLPKTKSVRWLGWSRSGDVVVELVQGNSLAKGRYTIQVRHLPPQGGPSSTIEFWLDRQFSHDIDDAKGSFRVEPAGPSATLLTYSVMVDLGGGVWKRMFEDKIREIALSTPMLVKDCLERR